MKKLLAGLLISGLLFSVLPVWAEEPTTEFCRLELDYPKGTELFQTDYQAYDRLTLRFADTQAPIPLSLFYDETFFATVPKESANRPLEVVVAEDLKFTDDTEEWQPYEFHVMGRAARRGVIYGDDSGAARPFDTITRAEATAMVLRLLGLETFFGNESGFLDVPSEAWYASGVTAARKIGLVRGDSETTFSPERKVSREEFLTMAARALWLTGLQKEPVSYDLIDAKDIGAVSYWAQSAYATLNPYRMAIWEETGEVDAEGVPETVAVIEPQKPILRHEAADTLNNLIEFEQVYPSRAAKAYGLDPKMPIVDGSTSSYPFTQAVYSGLFSNGGQHPDRPAKHSKSHASYERLINKEVDMLFAATAPSSDILALAKERGVELELIPIAYDAMVFFTNADNPQDAVTSKQLSEIYGNNAYDNWRDLGGTDAKLYPYCRNNDSGSHALMEKYFLNGKPIHETIRAETTSVSMANVLTDVMKSKTTDPVGYGLGYSIFYYFNQMDLFYDTKTELKLLQIDGVLPTDETIANGRYPLAENSYIVLRGDSPQDSLARKLTQFILSDAGKACVEAAGFGRLR